MSELDRNPDRIEQRTALVEAALAPGGLLYKIATAAVIDQVELAPSDVADILMPPRKPGEDYKPRWDLVENSPQIVKTAAAEHQPELLELAEALDLRKGTSIDEQTTAMIDGEKAIWVVEGGANRTSVVRRQLTVEAMQQVYGDSLAEGTIYQLGSGRKIPKEREKDGKMVANAEYAIAQEISGEYLPHGDLTEFELNLAGAKQAGFEVKADAQEPIIPSVERYVRMIKAGLPELVLIQPESAARGLVDGFEAVKSLAQLEQDFQLVVATNGQYRAKDELQADKWAKENGLATLSPVVIGDEPGFTVEHNGKEIITGERGPGIYLTEIVVLHRLNS
jgi:hypothetical protein